MTEREENITNMFISTAEFDAVNAADYRHLPDAETNFAIVRSVIAALQEYAAAQVSGAQGRAVEQKSVIRAAMRRKMTGFSRTARGLDIDDPGLRRLFRVPDENNDQLLLASAREFVEEATRFAVQFAGRGITAERIDALAHDITALDTAISTKSGAKTESVGATAGIDDRIEEGMRAEIILDSIMHNVYDDNPVKLAEWTSARHVRRVRRPAAKPAEPEKAND